VTGVRLTGGEVIAAGHVVVAGGAWSASLLERLGVEVPVRPIRGQILSLRATPPPLRHVVFCSDVYLAPKVDGSTLFGATYEDAGFDDRLTGVGISYLLLNGIRAAPAYANATFSGAWVGLRPASPDGMPILGAVPGWESLTLALGHSAEGILLSPITGHLIAQHVMNEAPDIELEPFGLQRFAPRREDT
jgi:glycine oxidase